MDAFLRQGLRARQSQPLTGRANDGGAPFDTEIHVLRSLTLLIEIAGVFSHGPNERHFHNRSFEKILLKIDYFSAMTHAQ
jgi:hypothetical protein